MLQGFTCSRPLITDPANYVNHCDDIIMGDWMGAHIVASLVLLSTPSTRFLLQAAHVKRYQWPLWQCEWLTSVSLWLADTNRESTSLYKETILCSLAFR